MSGRDLGHAAQLSQGDSLVNTNVSVIKIPIEHKYFAVFS